MQLFFYEIIFLAIIIFVYLFRKKLCIKTNLGTVALLITFGILASIIASCIPIPTERVVITALDQKNELSSETQVALASIIVDGKEYKLENPEQGKWFWRGDYYFWRSDNDSRRPDNLTDTIVINVPIGHNRAVGFDSWTNRGIVKVESESQIKNIDTYGEQANTIIFTDLNETNSQQMFLFKLTQALLYSLLILLFFIGFNWLVKKRGANNYIYYLKKNWDKIIFLICSLSMLIISIFLSGMQSFWGDEVHNLIWAHWENKNISFAELIYYNLTMNDATPPLFNIIEHMWLGIVPYGQEWALLMPEIITACGVFFVGLTASRLGVKNMGVVAAILACFSAPIFVQCCLELRAYCLLFTVSAITFYVYVLRYQTGMEKVKYDIIYGIVLTILLYSHYYGVLILGILFVADVFLLLLKHSRLTNLLSYFISTVLFLPWIIAVQNTAVYNPFDRTWNSVPTISDFMSTLKYLSGNVEVIAIIYFIASIYLLVKSCRFFKEKKIADNEYIYLITAILPFALVSAIFIYSAYISPESSKWHARYFVGAIPFIIISISAFVCKVMPKIQHSSNFIILCLFLTVYYGFSSVGYVFDTQTVRSSQYLYREAAEYIMTQNDIYDNKTAALVTLGGYKDAVVGWDYYLTHAGERDKINSYSAMLIDENTLCGYETIYLFVAYDTPSNISKILDNKFEQVHFDRSTNVYKYIRRTN